MNDDELIREVRKAFAKAEQEVSAEKKLPADWYTQVLIEYDQEARHGLHDWDTERWNDGSI